MSANAVINSIMIIIIILYTFDINECADNTDNCDANASSTNTGGSFTCTCRDRFTGDGETCTHIIVM